MGKFAFVASLLILSFASQSHALAQDLDEEMLSSSEDASSLSLRAAPTNESLVTLGLAGRCVGSGNALTVEWGGTARSFDIYYNGNLLERRTTPGTLTFRPGTRVSKITVKGCKNSVCDTDTQTWDGRDCASPGNPDPRDPGIER